MIPDNDYVLYIFLRLGACFKVFFFMCSGRQWLCSLRTENRILHLSGQEFAYCIYILVLIAIYSLCYVIPESVLNVCCQTCL